MNVLVYDGPGVSHSALQHTLRSLRRLLAAYDVQTINARQIALEPWQSYTALFVLPGGRDLPYLSSLAERFQLQSQSQSGTAAEEIARFVHAGGKFLGICAGAYFASSRCVFEPGTPMEVIGDRPAFRFFPAECVGTVYPGFVYESDAGARLIDLELELGEDPKNRDMFASMDSFKCQYNGGGAFLQADLYKSKGVDVLARYSHSDPVLTQASSSSSDQKPKFAGQAAAVLCQVGAGKALLYGVHPEFPLSTMSVYFSESVQHDGTSPSKEDASIMSDLERAEVVRLAVFGRHLALLGLKVDAPRSLDSDRPASVQQPPESPIMPPSITDPPRLTPLLLASPDLPNLLAKLQRASTSTKGPTVKHLSSVAALLAKDQLGQPAFTIVDGNDTLHILSAHTIRSGTTREDGSPSDADALWLATLQATYDDYVPHGPPSSSSSAAAAAGTATESVEAEAEPDLHSVPKYIVPIPAEAPDASTQEQIRHLAPHFDVFAYLAALRRGRERITSLLQHQQQQQQQSSLLAGIQAGPARWGRGGARLGDEVMYGQVVTSTQTMLDKNFKLLRTVPTGFTSIATHQVSGRGRGKNAWISPLGCFQFSLVLRLPVSAAPYIVFVQYLAALAVVLALRSGVVLPAGSSGEGEEEEVRSAFGRRVGEKVRIKWPNDLYAEVEEDEQGLEASMAALGLGERKGTFVKDGKRYAKLGGILVNSQFADNEFMLVVGCGVNVLNRRPTTSISDLILAANSTAVERNEPTLPILSQEDFGGGVLATFERLWSVFEQAGSFQPFLEAYREVWLHSNQLATLADTEPPTPIRIVGISSDYGFLRSVHASSTLTTASAGAWGDSDSSGAGAKAEREKGRWIDLQPDGNSFDMLHNLIRRKD
ncbi:unnamed protein product [Tilletia controversa]|uniref:BPL/LPL catalytic domain-containing protein n=3 Tax=Tilletia TaxID=13289 RepID=A0A8X7ST83_9BASI|nr:hypothetical protein CF336_g8038 [Tilletia laevis]KAE8184778.1 hypothetical protein CF328_g7750 [Tilletia controversa]KAE8244197.1 hypothetical protein A4X03_0g7608 [Tilletia caries]KAE8185842.1 hypothetical protein CF335_g7612 [Tilletia laevis]KAE8239286.1 hypothetical protein A4X06_0g8381 [Tilletia controversa]